DSAKDTPLPKSLGGARVTMNGVDAPIFYSDSAFVAVQVPAGIRADSVAIRLINGLGKSNIYRMPLATVSPAIFTDPDHPGQGEIFRFGPDGGSGWVSPAAPLRRGDTAVVVAGGIGPVA